MSTSLVDRQVLALLRRLPGADGQSLATELVGAYLVAAPERLADVRQAIDTSDWPLVRRIAHSLRGSAALLGAKPFAEMLYSIETQADAGDAGAVRHALDAVNAAWPETADALSETAASLREHPAGP